MKTKKKILHIFKAKVTNRKIKYKEKSFQTIFKKSVFCLQDKGAKTTYKMMI